MKNICRLFALLVAVLVLFSMIACAPAKIQGSFNASFSLSSCEESEDQYKYHFYGVGQGSEKNSTSGEIITFTYTAMNQTLTINTENGSFSYKYTIEDKKDINLTYQKKGKTESVLLIKK